MRIPSSIETDLFIEVVLQRLHGFALECAAGGEPPVGRFLEAVIRQVRAVPQAFSASSTVDVIANLGGSFYGARLCLSGRYKPVAQIPLAEAPPESLLTMLLGILIHAEMNSRLYGISLPPSIIALLLSDLAKASDRLEQPAELRLAVVNALIETGASLDLIRKCGGGQFRKDRAAGAVFIQ